MAVRTIPVTDPDDPRVEVFRAVRDRDLRGREHLFMAESELVLRRLLLRPERLSAILLTETRLAALGCAIGMVPDGIPVYVADEAVLTAIAGFHIHRGVLAAGIRPTRQALSIDAALGHLRGTAPLTLLVAEGFTNVDNMGALFRNAAAFGAGGIVLDPRSGDPLYRKAIRVSMGHVLSIPWAIGARWPADLARLRDEWRMTLVAAEVTHGAAPLWELPRAERMAIVFGSEAGGLGRETLALCDAICRIPMAGDVPSINVAVASAVFLYERQRSRDHAPPTS